MAPGLRCRRVATKEVAMIRRALLSLAVIGGLAAAPAAMAQNCDTSIQVVNNSGVQVDELYFNPTSMSDWGPDRLGQNVLPAGRSTNYRPNRGGAFDFKVVWSGGRAAEIRGVDVCTVSRIVVGGRGLSAE
jgi:hypothetical protein